MYKLVLADDEVKIRTLLSELINWNELGFELSDVFSDGGAVIEHIKSKHTDCVLCDIRMSPTSGLDVAEYIYNNKPNVKIMLMSGYQEFSYANAALKYGVENYFLKPVRIDEIKKALAVLKTNLDREKNNAEIISLYKRDILNKLINGIYNDESSINKALSSVDSTLHSQVTCALCSIEICKEVILSTESITNLLSNVADFHSNHFRVHFLNIENETASFVIFADIASENSLRLIAQNMCQSLKEITGESASVISFAYYKTIKEMCTKYSGINSQIDKNLTMYEKHIISAINSGSADDVNDIFMQMSKLINNFDYIQVQSYYNSLSQKIHNELIPDIKNETSVFFEEFEAELSKCENIGNLNNAFIKLLSDLVSILQNTDIQIKNIIKIRNYIAANYMEDLSLEKVSQMANLSPSWFSSSFKSVTGQSFISFIISCRMNAAKEMLVSTNKKVHEISTAVGYKNFRSFTKLFNLNCGMTPMEYRNKYTKGGM